jgi:fatty acid desaturase
MDYETYAAYTTPKAYWSWGIGALVAGCIAFFGGVLGVLASIPIGVVLALALYRWVFCNAEERAFFDSSEYSTLQAAYRRRQRVALDARIYYESLIPEAELDMYVSEVLEEVVQIAKATARAGRR